MINKYYENLYLKFVITSSVAVKITLALGLNSAFAQITPDTTLSNISNVNLENNVRTITGGTQAGGNLFHSFQEFSVPTNTTAYFNNTTDIQNILTRVTGGSVSNIDGIIRANGKANLFLINPSGIIFGQNAQLNIDGSFLGTTANGLQFGSLGNFSATNPEAPSPILRINPSALLFNQIVTAPIENNSTVTGGKKTAEFDVKGLRVPDGKSLLLVGGNITMNGSGLNAYGGRVELGGLASSGTVGLTVDNNNLSLSFPEKVTRADISLTNGAFVGVQAAGGGSIVVNARDLEILGGSQLFGGFGIGLGMPNSIAGNIILNVTGKIRIVGEDSGVFNNVRQQARGQGGNVIVNTGELIVRDGGGISASTSGLGNSGDLIVNASDSVVLEGEGSNYPGGLLAQVNTEGTGNGGNLNVVTRRLTVSNGSKVQASTFSQSPGGKAGNLFIRAEEIEVLGTQTSFYSTGIFAAVSRADIPGLPSLIGKGSGGSLTIETGRLSITGGGEVSASTLGEGKGGNLTVTAKTIELFGSYLSANAEEGSAGDAGKLTINTGSLAVRGGSQVSASTSGRGNSGDLTIHASDSVILDGEGPNFPGGLFAQINTEGTGNGGNLNIETRRLSVSDGSKIQVSSFSQSPTVKAGNLFIRADEIEVLGTPTSFYSTGIFAEVSRTDVPGYASILGKGTGGNVNINANFIHLQNQGMLGAQSVSGGAGNIDLQVRDLLLLSNNSSISTTAGTEREGGDGGNITINISNGFIVARPNQNNDITANAFTGRGGKVEINTSGIFGMQLLSRKDLERLNQINPENLSTNDITAVSQENPTLSGTVNINTPDVDPNRGLVELPTNLVDVVRQISTACVPGGEYTKNYFTVTGRGGIPDSPTEILQDTNTIVDWINLPQNREILSSGQAGNSSQTKPQSTSGTRNIVEANGFVTDTQGKIHLVVCPNRASFKEVKN
ncbi:MAG: filamentous hemagglutinin N-terminal domain-containing protein [Scytonematopsis contorta HA4267-MV1]|jgi:filamentous hemagglutinin family protein|nr:filamentous hemagglutinin N-terminal domain-containing protein [Scytonematopsis contorta HA4267-MV1]